MKYLDTTSLFRTVDNVSEAFFFASPIGPGEKSAIADFIVGRQGRPYAYAETFAPTDLDLKRDLLLFTGEKITTGAGKCHTIGEEASRILRKLKVNTAPAENALQRADAGMRGRIYAPDYAPRHGYGTFCCKPCSCALWLNLSAGGLGNDVKLLRAGMERLKKYRDGKGKWFGFPFYYILYILNEMDPDLAGAEMRYAGNVIEKRLKRKHADADKYEARRDRVCERILDKINSD